MYRYSDATLSAIRARILEHLEACVDRFLATPVSEMNRSAVPLPPPPIPTTENTTAITSSSTTLEQDVAPAASEEPSEEVTEVVEEVYSYKWAARYLYAAAHPREITEEEQDRHWNYQQEVRTRKNLRGSHDKHKRRSIGMFLGVNTDRKPESTADQNSAGDGNDDASGGGGGGKEKAVKSKHTIKSLRRVRHVRRQIESAKVGQTRSRSKIARSGTQGCYYEGGDEDHMAVEATEQVEQEGEAVNEVLSAMMGLSSTSTTTRKSGAQNGSGKSSAGNGKGSKERGGDVLGEVQPFEIFEQQQKEQDEEGESDGDEGSDENDYYEEEEEEEEGSDNERDDEGEYDDDD